jgi:16S rRNA (guanine527-N7)-methyltransferase
MNLAAALEESATALGIDIGGAAQARLLAYLALLQKWNRVYRLTGARDARDILVRHVLDALAVVPHVTATTVLDVGSGAGLPGIPIAIALPAAQVTLIDSSEKKAAFLQQALIELKLDNVAVICERVEIWNPGEPFDLVISRAFSDLAEFARLAGRLCAKRGALAAMKGLYPSEELARVPKEFKLQRVVPLRVPGLRAARHLVLLERGD